MLRQNMHIHSKYSWDSQMEIEEITQVLVEGGVDFAAITDHIDFDRDPLTYTLIKLKIRNLDIDRENERNKGKIKILKAAEISEPHLYRAKVEMLQETGLDFLMGSIHDIDKKATTAGEIAKVKMLYYKEILKMVESKTVDAIGHLDYIDRYYGPGNDSVEQIKEIMDAIRENNQIIEINTSAKRRNNLTLFPNLERIIDYKKTNDEVIIGTDAHRYNELLDNIEAAEKTVVDLSLKPVIYQKRKRIII